MSSFPTGESLASAEHDAEARYPPSRCGHFCRIWMDQAWWRTPRQKAPGVRGARAKVRLRATAQRDTRATLG